MAKTHCESHTRLHNIWCGINKRCKSDVRYGGRGIIICEEWKDYENFAKWARENGYTDELTIERIDVNGNYCPSNCTWIPLGKQARNRRTTFWVEYNGKTMSLAQASEEAGLPYKQVFFRIKHGWTPERALSTPLFKKSELHKRCDSLGINYHTVYSRLKRGWSEEDAINIEMKGIGANQTSYSICS